MSNDLTPLEVCERLIAPIPALGPLLGISDKAPYAWRYPARDRDAGDLPSMRYQRLILAHAEARGIPLDPVWLIRGAPRDAVDAVAATLARAA